MTKHLFTKLIKCDNCGCNYIYILDRNIPKYICGAYSRRLIDGCTTRNTVNQNLLIGVIEEYCNIYNMDFIKSNSFLKSIIKQIIVNIDDYTIYYKDGHVSCISPSIIKI